jgi:uncharacterized protein (DUF2267 family)
MTQYDGANDDTSSATDPSQTTDTNTVHDDAGDTDCGTAPEHVAETVRADANYRCQVCGRRDAQRGGSTRIEVHHRDSDPDHCDYHDAGNLTALCPACHRWHHRQPDSAGFDGDLGSRIEGADLDPTRLQVLQFLADHGPATTGTILQGVDLTSQGGVHNVVYSLMAADVRNPSVTGRLVVKDIQTREYGLPWQIPDSHDARGVVPVALDARRTRILDEIARRLYAELPEYVDDQRQLVANIVNRRPDQTVLMQRRAEAFQFPFETWFSTDRVTNPSQRAVAAAQTVENLSDSISEGVVAGVLSEVFEGVGEPELAQRVRAWASGEARQIDLSSGGQMDRSADPELEVEWRSETVNE